MNGVASWMTQNWSAVAIPASVWLLSLIALMWLRAWAYGRLAQFSRMTGNAAANLVARSLRVPSMIWCVIIGTYLAIAVSSVPQEIKAITGKALWSLFVVSVTISAVVLARGVADLYGSRTRVPHRTLAIMLNVARGFVCLVAVLVVLDIWGGPTSPILLFIAVAVLVAALSLRDTAPNVFAGFQLAASQKIKVGDYIKLDSGEEGYVEELTWSTTQVRSLEGNVVMVPNNRLVRQTVTNYGHPLKQAKEPFHFFSRTHLTELTGLKARNLRELTDVLKTAPDSVVYYHTHHFVEEHQFLVPEPSNDFTYWVGAALNDDVLAERLAAISVLDFSSLAALRDRLVGILEEYLASSPGTTQAPEGMEFHFMKSIAAVMPTSYAARDLREFVEALRKVSDGSVYFHLFESRLRLGKPQNDFSIWLQDNIDEPELAQEIAHLDIYSSTLEDIRSTLISLIEKRIK